MKICRIIDAYSPYSFGGADMRAEIISRELVNRNNPTTIITINPHRGETVEEDNKTKIYRFHPFNISTIHSIGNKSIIKQGVWTLLDIYSYFSYWKIRNILKKEKPDIVHLHTPIDVTLSAVNAVKSLKLPLVYTLHDYFLLCRRFVLLHGFKTMCTDKNINLLCRAYRKLTKRITDNKIDIVIAPSQFVLDMHIKYGFFEKSKNVVLPHGIDLKNIEESSIKVTNCNFLNILYIGTLRSHKGVHILINAFKKIKNDNIKLHIVGEGADKIDLERLSKNDGRIVFYGKFPNQEAQKFYKMADIVVVPSIWYDVRPNVIPEAFRAGIPVVGSNIGGIPELIRHNYNGFLFEVGNIEQLKQILENTAKRPDILIGLGKNALESVKEFEMNTYIEKLIKIYEEAIKMNQIQIRS